MRLELTHRGDYAIRAMIALGHANGLAGRLSVRRIAAQMTIPVAFLPRVMRDLVAAGLVEATAGRTGGYRLARPAEAISLLAIIESIEGESGRRSCVLDGAPCPAHDRCEVHDVFFSAQAALLDRLRRTTLSDLLALGDTRPPVGLAEREALEDMLLAGSPT
jgi:Rrf2 family iron-sulfur cluster assembly transcriptional regulator